MGRNCPVPKIVRLPDQIIIAAAWGARNVAVIISVG